DWLRCGRRAVRRRHGHRCPGSEEQRHGRRRRCFRLVECRNAEGFGARSLPGPILGSDRRRDTLKYRIVFFDVDSTLVSIEGIDELARGNAEVARLTEAAMNGE